MTVWREDRDATHIVMAAKAAIHAKFLRVRF